MADQIKQEQVKGLVRNSDSSYTAVMTDGSRRTLDKGEAGSLMKRLDKDRSQMERAGTREERREPEKRMTAEEKFNRQKASQEAFMNRFNKKG